MQFADVTIDMLFEAHRSMLRWQWLAGQSAAERKFAPQAIERAKSSADLAGYLNFIHPHRVQVLGEQEIAYLQSKPQDELVQSLNAIVPLEPPVLIVADAQQVPEHLVLLCERAPIPLFTTNESAAYVIDVLRAWLSKRFAQRTSVHGVFMDIFGIRVLLVGESGLGKSELGLELISRGHGLVADDVVDFALVAQGIIEGRCPPLLENLLEVRGIGLLDIRTIFGETAMRRKMRLKLIVHLVRREVLERDFERLPLEPLEQDVLGVAVRKVMIPVEAGRNIAVLVEAAVRNTVLQLRGIDTFSEFLSRHHRAMDDGGQTESSE